MEDITFFVGKVRKANDNGVLTITIPKYEANYEGIKPGDYIKVYFRKLRDDFVKGEDG